MFPGSLTVISITTTITNSKEEIHLGVIHSGMLQTEIQMLEQHTRKTGETVIRPWKSVEVETQMLSLCHH